MNFVRVLKGLFCFSVFGEFMLGGESQQGRLSHVSGCSVRTHCIGKRSYLEPISQSLQKTIERTTRIRAFSRQTHVGKPIPVYLEPIRNRMQTPIAGRSRTAENVEDRVSIDRFLSQ